MNPAKYRHRITLQAKSTAGTAISGPGARGVWVNSLVGLHAEITPLSGARLVAAQQIKPEIRHSIKVRYQAALADPVAVSAMRVLFNGRIFEIGACINVAERNEEIELLCSEGVSNG